MNKDYYAILGVEPTATSAQIKTAFRALAHTHHPDKGGDEKKFKEINEAYQTLSHAKKRAEYDRFGSAAQSFSGFSGGGYGGAAQDFGGFGNTAGYGGFENARYYTTFTRGSGQRFTMSSLKKVPWFLWLLLLPFIVLVVIIGTIVLFIMFIRSMSRKA